MLLTRQIRSKMAKAASKKVDFWHGRQGYVVEIALALLVAYGVASLAINSGSLIQYFLTFALLGFVINRLTKLFKR